MKKDIKNKEKLQRVRIKKKFSESQLNLIETMTKKIAKEFGVTVVHDENGRFGPDGYTYVTLRWNNGGNDLVQIQMAILKVDE